MSVKTFTLRMNDEQHQFLERKANELGITKNDYIRQLINGEITNDRQEKILSELLEIKEMLKRMEN